MREIVPATQSPVRARVLVTAKPMWRIRLTRELPRVLLLAAAAAGLAASARYAVSPPRPVVEPHLTAVAPARDAGAEGFAQLFARRYLTWEADEPESHQQALAPFVGAGMEPGAGLQPPPGGEEQVSWTDIVQERVILAADAADGEQQRLYTVAAQTDTAGLVYLAVDVARTAGGALTLAGYPAFVGAPAFEPSIELARGREVSNPALRTVLGRALRNYLAGSATELAADLTSAARVSPPAQGLSLESIQSLNWSSTRAGAVDAVVQATDGRGARYTLAYELAVVQVAARWEVAAIETDPDT